MRASQAHLRRTRAGAAVRSRRLIVRAFSPTAANVKDAEQAVLAAIRDVKGRGKSGLSDSQQQELTKAIDVLESTAGLAEPTASPALDGMWRLLYTSRPGTSSPIQRTFVGVDAFTVYQEVDLLGVEPRVNNIVDFGANIGYLKVEALASTSTRPLAGFTPRRGAGLALLGRSLTHPPARPNMRIDFQFDRAAFRFAALPVTIPYPVPFRALGNLGGELGDETKGWLDTTYLSESGTFRLSRGNKGTLFVLQKDEAVSGVQFSAAGAAVPQAAAATSVSRVAAAVRPAGGSGASPDALLAAVSSNAGDAAITAIIDALSASGAGPDPAPARSPAVCGVWRLVWSQQSETASPLQKWGSSQVRSYQVIDSEASTLENVVDLGVVTVRAQASCSPDSDTRTRVVIGGGGVYIGGVKLPLPVRGEGFVDWLWLDERVRVTRGSKGSLFVHVREPGGILV